MLNWIKRMVSPQQMKISPQSAASSSAHESPGLQNHVGPGGSAVLPARFGGCSSIPD